MAHIHALDADEVLILVSRYSEQVNRFVLQVVDTGSLSTSFVIKGRIRGLADAELKSLPYINRATGATVAAGTAITAEGIFEVDATGIEVVLDNNWTSGSGTVHYYNVIG